MVRRVYLTFAAVCVAALGLATPLEAQTGSITGKVSDSSAAGVPGVGLHVYNSTTQGFVAQATCPSTTLLNTCADGTYQVTGLSTGSYYVITYNVAGLVDQYYKSSGTVSCGGCQFATSGASAVSVGTGPTPNINFTLVSGPRLRGRVTHGAGNPLVNVGVGIYLQSNASFAASFPSTLSDGTFVSGAGLPPGTYAAFTSSSNVTFPGGEAYIERDP